MFPKAPAAHDRANNWTPADRRPGGDGLPVLTRSVLYKIWFRVGQCT